MDVEHVKELDEGHTIEIGAATWNSNDRSVRNRYQTSTGGFSPHSSSEIPMSDLADIIVFVANHEELSVSECAKMIIALAASIQAQESAQ